MAKPLVYINELHVNSWNLAQPPFITIHICIYTLQVKKNNLTAKVKKEIAAIVDIKEIDTIDLTDDDVIKVEADANDSNDSNTDITTRIQKLPGKH